MYNLYQIPYLSTFAGIIEKCISGTSENRFGQVHVYFNSTPMSLPHNN
jgi:hypothetical protein